MLSDPKPPQQRHMARTAQMKCGDPRNVSPRAALPAFFLFFLIFLFSPSQAFIGAPHASPLKHASGVWLHTCIAILHAAIYSHRLPRLLPEDADFVLVLRQAKQLPSLRLAVNAHVRGRLYL